MKKLLIVNDNLELGGIQKSLLCLLKELGGDYEPTLCLLYPSGAYLPEVPRQVRVITVAKGFGVLGAVKKSLQKKPVQYLWKGFLLVLARLFHKKAAIRAASLFQKKLTGYDTVISYSHASTDKRLTSCCAEFVLEKTEAKEKICFIHCDYAEEGNHCAYTDSLYARFDKIACCSDSVRERFLSVLPGLRERTYTVRNFYDLGLPGAAKDCGALVYGEDEISLVSIARMTREKGLDRAILALSGCGRRELRYYIVGDGPERRALEELIEKQGLSDRVVLFGYSDCPEKYLKNADYLLVPSYHEAAPMVFDEAALLGVPVITTNTASARELAGERHGIVCENSVEGIEGALAGLEKPKRQEASKVAFTNALQREQLMRLLGG